MPVDDWKLCSSNYQLITNVFAYLKPYDEFNPYLHSKKSGNGQSQQSSKSHPYKGGYQVLIKDTMQKRSIILVIVVNDVTTVIVQIIYPQSVHCQEIIKEYKILGKKILHNMAK